MGPLFIQVAGVRDNTMENCSTVLPGTIPDYTGTVRLSLKDTVTVSCIKYP